MRGTRTHERRKTREGNDYCRGTARLDQGEGKLLVASDWDPLPSYSMLQRSNEYPRFRGSIDLPLCLFHGQMLGFPRTFGD